MTAIRTRNLTKSYGPKTAVDSLNLTIGKGELYALLGVNGAGKTTTIKMLSCLTKPSSGEAEVMGFDLNRSGEIKAGIGVSPQETAVAPNLTVAENLELMCGIYGSSPAEARQRTEEYLAKFGMENISKDRAKTLSGGWQRRLSIAMALVSDPEVLFLDEPTLGLDVLARKELWAIIESLKVSKTIILTTHYLEEAEALSDRIGIMKSGRLVAVGTAEELIAEAGSESFEDAFIALASESAAGGAR